MRLLVMVSVSMLFLPSVCLYDIELGLAEWPPFGREMLIRLTICSLCVLTYCNFSYFPLWF